MANDKGPVDNFVDALRFSVSNVASLAIWGIVYVVAIFISVFIMIFSIFAFEDYPLAMIALLIVGFLPILAMGVLLLGFASQCMKTVIDGGSVMPTGLESPGDLVKDGIMTFVILLEAVVLEFVCFAPGFLLIFLAGSHNSTLILAGLVLILLAFPVIMVVFFLNVVQWAVYAGTGSLVQGLNPLKPLRLVLSSPGGAIVAAVSVFAANLLYGIIGFACELTIIGVILLPFLVIAMYGGMAYLIAVFYRQSRGDDGLRDIRDAVSADFSTS